MRIRTRRDIAVFVGCLMFIALVLVNGMNLLLMTPEDHLKHLFVATLEIVVVTTSVGIYIGLKLRQITQLNERLEFAVAHDHLTGAKTRQSFYDFMQRNDIWPCTIIMTDIDNFKHFNDSFGHNTGDQVLVNFVAIVSSHIRKEDILARFGGEEFVIALPNRTFCTGLHLAERMRESVASQTFDMGDHEVSITASFGICQIEHAAEVKSAIQRADQAIYLAKKGGRNQVRTSDRADPIAGVG